MKLLQIITIAISALLMSVSSIAMQKLTIITEDYPPYNYPGKNNKAQGFAVDLLEAVIKKINAPQKISKIKILPWPRGYSLAQNPSLKNMLFSTTRTKERESLFKWVGPITDTKIVVFAAKGHDVTVNSIDDLKQYKFVAVRGGIGSILLASNGVPKSNISLLNKFTLLPGMIDKKRADMFAYEQSSAIDTMKKAGIDPTKYKVVYTLKKAELFYAFNMSVDRATIEAYQKGLDAVKADKAFMESIRAKHLQ